VVEWLPYRSPLPGDSPTMSLTPRTRRWARRGAAAAAVAGSLALAPTAAHAAVAVPPPPTEHDCPKTVVKSAELVRTVTGPAILVQGIAPGPNVKLHLVPEDVVFIRQPEYWNYFVIDCAADAGPITKTPYTKLFRVPTGPLGSVGIQIGPSTINLFPGPYA
jgi:hypothetical protein